MAHNRSSSGPLPVSSGQKAKVTNQWKIGSLCEIYSETRREWIVGEIIHMYTDEKGCDWFRVKCGQIITDVPRDYLSNTTIDVSVGNLQLINKMVSKNPDTAPILQKITAQSGQSRFSQIDDNAMSWNKVLQCVNQELFPVMAVKLRECVQEKMAEDPSFKMTDIGNDAEEDIMERLKMKRNMNNKEISYLERLFERARKYAERKSNQKC